MREAIGTLDRPSKRSELSWPSFDGKDVFYDIEEFLADFRRVSMIASGG